MLSITKTKRFHNHLSFERNWLDEQGSEDCQGRAIWALGTGVGRSLHRSFQMMAGQLFALALPALTGFTSPRAWAFGLIGIHEYLRRLSGDSLVNQTRETLTCRLMDLFEASAHPDWQWFEEELSYDNAKLAHALIVSGHATGQQAVLDRGLRALRWLTELQMSEKGHFRPIGSNGFYRRGGTRADFDQQPIEAQATVSACLEAYRATSDVRWYEARAVCLRLVHRLERSRIGTLLSRDRRLLRRIACGPSQREPGSGIDPGLLAFLGGDAAGAEHADEFSRTDHPHGVAANPHSHAPQTYNHNPPSRPVPRSPPALQSGRS